MALSAGTKLGGYQIVDALGAGGMGEVYRARDTKLGRVVALKVLPEALAFDADRIARFEREAKALAALNHPHIAALFGLEQSEGRHFLVMELVDGETLQQRIARGPLPLAEALTVARQIAEALEAAHEKGIIHRDLKPANVKLTAEGEVKVLDFGLAKAVAPAGSTGSAEGGALTHSPTLSMMATQAGMILGTAAYMSPEQAKGFAADQRSDIFSFGVVLYEMLTGRQPFHGATAPEILASVLIRDADLTSLQRDVHPRLVELLERCLQKNPKQRWQHIGDVRAELDTIAADPRGAAARAEAAAPAQPWTRRVWPMLAAAAASAAVAAATTWTMTTAPSPLVMRFAIPLAEGQQFTNPGRQLIAISSDGAKIVYVANERLFLRTLGEFEARPISGSETTGGVLQPVFSPDGASIAYWSVAEQAIKRIPTIGGTAVTIAASTSPFGMRWEGDHILLGRAGEGIVRIPAAGGSAETIVKAAADEFAHGPQLLPGGDAVLFTLGKGLGADRWDHAKVMVESLSTHQRVDLVEGGTDGRYLRTGHLVYAVGGLLFAAPFDPRRPERLRQGTPVIEGVRRAGPTGTAQFAVSDTGALIYLEGPASLASRQLDVAIVDPNGAVESLHLPQANYQIPRVSPDGRRLAVSTDERGDRAIWVYDLARTSSIRKLTFSGRDSGPLWSADGQHVIFESDRDGEPALLRVRADGAGTPERLTKFEAGVVRVPEAASPDGRYLLIGRSEPRKHTIEVFTFADRTIKPFGSMTSLSPPTPAFSPDGRWVAYTKTSTSVGSHVFVEPFPPDGTTYDIGVGIHPVWSRDGTQLYFGPGQGRFGRVPITTSPAFSFGNQVPVVRRTSDAGPTVSRPFDVLPDGRFVGVIAGGTLDITAASASRIDVVLNWFDELKRRVPTR